MYYTMNASYMERAFYNTRRAYDVKSIQNPDPLFLEKMAQIYRQKDSASQPGEGMGRIPTEGMTIEEYKRYVYDKIAKLPTHETNMQDYVCVQISEAGMEAMRQDAEYEQWVLDSIKSNFMSRDPWSGMCGGKYMVLSFGATKEQSRVESWRAGYLNGSGSKLFQKKSQNGFWERRAKRMEELQEMYEEKLEVKELSKDLDKGMYYGQLDILSVFKPKPMQADAAQG